MKDREPPATQEEPVRKTNRTVVVLLACVVLLGLAVLYLATRGNPDQDKLTGRTGVASAPSGERNEKLCASGSTYELIKRELFRRAAQLRGNDQVAFDRLSSVAAIRMENPVMEGADPSTGSVNCSGSFALDLPPGLQVMGGRHTLRSDIDYTVATAADRSGPVVLLKNADPIITSLATVSTSGTPSTGTQQPGVAAGENNPNATDAEQTTTQPTSPAPASKPVASEIASPPVQQVQRPVVHTSFDCGKARTRGEIAVCGDPGLASLDRQMAALYARASAEASPEEQDILRSTAHRFYAYRDRCPTNACINDAYAGRMREIRDIMEGRWQPSQ